MSNNPIQHPEVSSSCPKCQVKNRPIAGQIVPNPLNPSTLTTVRANLIKKSTESPELSKIRLKCFLSTCIVYANSKSKERGRNVRHLVQRLIYGILEIQEFINLVAIECECNPKSIPKGFFEFNLPHLRYALMINEETLEGIQPPLRGSVPYPYPPEYIFREPFNAQAPSQSNRPLLNLPAVPIQRKSRSTKPQNAIIKRKKLMAVSPNLNVLNYLASLPASNN